MSTGYTMSAIVQRMKNEADRKAEEERQARERERRLEEMRRFVPVGPPTREESTYVKTGVQLPKVVNRTSYQRPATDTSTPLVQPSAPAQDTLQVTQTTLPDYTQPYQEPVTKKPEQQWNPPIAPRNMAVAQPTLAPMTMLQGLPSLVQAAPNLLQQGGKAIADWANSFQLPNVLQQPGMSFNEQLAAETSGPQYDPRKVAVDLTQQRIQQRADERRGNSLGQGAIRQALGHFGTGLSNMVDLVGLLPDLVQTTPIGDTTIGQELGKAYRVEDIAKEKTGALDVAGLLGVPGVPTGSAAYDDWRMQVLGNIMGLVNPQVWSQLPNVAEYWDMANKEWAAGLTPTKEQRKYNTDAIVYDARNLAIAMADQGPTASFGVFDSKLDLNVEIAKRTEKANQLATMADSTPDPVQRQMYLVEAGRLGAQAVKLRETTTLDLYNQNEDVVRNILSDSVLDPSGFIDIATDLTRLGVAARRYQQGQRVAAGLTQQKSFIDTLKDNPIVEWLKLNMSKGMTDAFTNFSVLTNILSHVETKGDTIAAILKYADGTLAMGMDASQMTSPTAPIQAVDGLVHFGTAGINDWRAQKARPALQGIVSWVPNLPSLQGEASELVSRVEVMGDLLGMLVRGGAMRHGVSNLQDVPWGTANFNVIPTANGRAVVQFIDSARNVIGQTADMSTAQATKAADNFTKALAKGQEFKTNYVKAVGDFKRNILSTYTLNSSMGGIITNAVGGQLTAVMDRGFSMDIFKPIQENVEYLAAKFGGYIPEARLAEGVGKIESKVPIGNKASATGNFAQGWQQNLGRILNWTTLGLSEPLKKLRQGADQIPGTGISVGEEAIAFNVYTAAFKEFTERELPVLIGREVQAVLQQFGVADPTTVKRISDQVIQSGLSGSRVDVARTFQDIANGKVGLSLRTLSPAFAHAFTHEQVLEIDSLLRNVTAETVPQIRQRISQIIQQQKAVLDQEFANFETVAGKRFYTTLDDLKDVADVTDVFENAARVMGKSRDEALELGRRLGVAQNQINEQMLNLLQMAQQKPVLADYIYNVWGQLRRFKDDTRANIARLSEQTSQYAKQFGTSTSPFPIKNWQPQRYGRVKTIDELSQQDPEWRLRFLENGLEVPRMPGSPYNWGDVNSKRASRWWGSTYEDATLLISKMKDAFQISQEHAEATFSLLEARANSWASYTGKDPGGWFQTYIYDIVRTRRHQDIGLAFYDMPWDEDLASTVAATQALFREDLQHLAETDRLAILAHELGHVFRYDMQSAAKHNPELALQWEEAKAWSGMTDALNQAGHLQGEALANEEFANSFVRYLQSGQAPSPALQGVFDNFKSWLQNLWEYFARYIRGDSDPASVKKTFDQYFTPAPAQVPPAGTQQVPPAGGVPPAGAQQAPPAGGTPPTGTPQTPQEAWEQFYALADTAWQDYAKQSLEFIEKAREYLLTGNAAADLRNAVGNIQQPLIAFGTDYGDETYGSGELLSDLAIDPKAALEFMKQKIGFASQDPMWEPAIKTYRETLDKFQAEMFTALSRYPNIVSFDEFMDAFSDVKQVRRTVLGSIRKAQDALKVAQDSGDEKEIAKAFGILRSTNTTQWNRYWQFAFDRFHAGAMRILEVNARMNLMETLEFSIHNDPGSWRLKGPSIKYPGKWTAIASDGRVRDNMSAGNAGGGVPKAIIDRYKEIQQIAQVEMNEQIARIAAQARMAGSGAAEVDALLQNAGVGSDAMVAQIRRGVQQYMANYENIPLDPQANLPRWYADVLDSAELSLGHALQEVASMNAGGYGRLTLDAVGEFNRRVLPIFDNVMSGAKRYGNEMVSVSVLDYTNQYHPDVLLALAAPYHFFFTRQGKNTLERMIFNPRVHTQVARYFREIQNENRRQEQPDRNIESVPGGINVEDVNYRVGGNLLARWIPSLPVFFMHGWGDPDRANRAYEYAAKQAKAQGFPGSSNTAIGDLTYIVELAKEFGLGVYPNHEALLGLLRGEKFQTDGMLAQMSPLHRTLGWGAVNFALWARENNIPLVPDVLEGYAQLATPDYREYLYARQASMEANRGNLSDTEAGFVQDIAMQNNSGQAPLPEQAMLAPEAQQQYDQTRGQVAGEYLIRTFLTWLTGAPIASVYEPEMELRKEQEIRGNSTFTPSQNPAGSQAALFAPTDEASPTYVPGLQPFLNQYAVMGESEFNKPSDKVDRPALDAVRSEYYDQREAIKQKYLAEEQKAFAAHPEWATREGSDAKKEFVDALSARRDAEYEVLDSKYPTVAGKFSEPSPWSLYGARPNETMREAQDRLLQQAYKNVEHLKPADDDPPGYWDKYNEALNAELTRLMNDPKAASDSVFGRALPQTQPKQPGPTADILRGTGKETTAPLNPTQPQQAPSVAPTEYDGFFAANEQKFNLPAGMLSTLAKRESNYTPAPANGYGMFQIENPTWKDIQAANPHLTDRENPEQAAEAAAWYLNWVNEQLEPDKKGKPEWIAAGYNMGVTAVNRMESLEDIKQYDKYGQQRYSYVNEIAAASTGGVLSQPAMSSTTAVGRPFEGDHRLTQEFGVNPERYKSWGGHMGLDYSMPEGTPLLATEAGTVLSTGNSPKGGTPSAPGTGGFGNWVIVQYPNGYTAEYAHLSRIDVKPGDKVNAGDVLGLSGHTGVSDFPHLHFGVRKDGEYIDPHTYLERAVSQPSVAVQPTDPTQPGVTAPAVPAGSSGVAWGSTPEELIQGNLTRNKSDARVEAEASVTAEFEQLEQFAKDKYPKHAHLWEEYRMVRDEDKQAFNEANPAMRALNLAAYNQDEWTHIEKTFGAGIVEKWAFIPRGDDIGEEAGAYYRQYPDVFLAKAYIDGRPEPYRDEGFDPTKPYERDFGKDYETAKSMFGDNIWDIVRQYYTIPKWEEGGENAAWKAFKKANPVFDEWRAWWYALMGDQRASEFDPFSGFARRGFSGFSTGTSGTRGGRNTATVDSVRAAQVEVPKWSDWGGSDDGWRKYMNIPLNNLRNWSG